MFKKPVEAADCALSLCCPSVFKRVRFIAFFIRLSGKNPQWKTFQISDWTNGKDSSFFKIREEGADGKRTKQMLEAVLRYINYRGVASL